MFKFIRFYDIFNLYRKGGIELDFKLVAIDMDGTLLNTQNKVSERTKKAIEEASKKGVHVVLATGRILTSAVNYSEELGLEKPIIACNGAIIVDKSKNIIYQKSINMDTVSIIMEIGKKNNMYYHFYDKNSFYSNIYVEDVVKFYNTRNAKGKGKEIKVNIFNEINEITEKEDLDIYKFIFLDEDRGKLQNLRNRLSEIKDINVCSSWSNNIEVVDKEVSKGNSLRYLCEKLDIQEKQVIAIGDNENDLSMLNYAGLSVAMGNGEEIVKSSADIVTSSNDEDGVAKVIEKYILKMGDEA